MRTTTAHPTRGSGRRRFALGSVSVVTGLALAACGGGATPQEAAQGGGAAVDAPEFTGEYTGPDVELAFWNGFTGGDGPFMEQLVEDFEAEHDNISITPNTIQWGDFYQRVPAAVQAGEGPDVGVMHMDQLATNAARNVIVPVTELAENLELSADDFTEEVWNAGEYNGERYGIPLDVHSLAMYYNTEHFEAAGITEPPTDMESFMAALDALKAAGYETPFWMPQRWPAHLIWFTLNWQNGGELYDEEGTEAQWAQEPGVEALTWMRSMVEQGYSPPQVDIDSQYAAFKNGENSITFDGIWQVNDLAATDLPWAMAPIPTFGDTDAVWANSHNFFITRQATEDENKYQAAQVFIAWISEQSGLWAQSGMIPARNSVREEGAMEGLPHATIAEEIESMRFLPPIPGVGQVQTELLEPAVSEGVLGSTPPADALEQAASQANELLERNREQFGG